MKNMAKLAAVVAILALALMGSPATSVAAPNHGGTLSVERPAGLGLLDMVLNILGFNTGAQTSARPNTPGTSTVGVSPSTPSSSISSQPSKGVTPNTAIWGGQGRCQFPPCR